MSSQDPAYLHIDGGVAVITLNRPKKRNALDPELVVCLANLYEKCKANTEVFVVILTGTGGCFCAGADLEKLIPLSTKSRQPESEADALVSQNWWKWLGTALLRDFDMGKPVIAAINGHAIAGGLEIVLGTDIRVAHAGCKFGLQEVKVGLLPAGGSTARLTKQLPFAVAMELMTTGTLLDAERAHQFGFINYLVDKGQVLGVAMKIARKIVANAPVAVQLTREAARLNVGRPDKEALAIELLFADNVMRSPDAIEGPQSFLAKRPPTWAKL